MKHYLIVGASSGIGFELASRLSEHSHVTAISRTSKNVTDLPNTTWHEADLSLSAPAFPVIEGPIDGLVYCPGTINLKPFRSLKEEDFLQDWNTNFMGAVRTIKQYLPQLSASEHPSILLFSTVAVQTGMAFHAGISSAKGAVEGLTRSLAAEFAPKIRVNAIAPSLTDTPLAEKLLNADAKRTAAQERHPLKTIGTPQQLAEAALYLLQANWVTGQILKVDGGISSIR